MAVFSEEPSDSEEEGVASDVDIREEVEANKKKKKKVDFAKAAEKAAKEKDSAAHAFSGTGQPLNPEGPARLQEVLLKGRASLCSEGYRGKSKCPQPPTRRSRGRRECLRVKTVKMMKKMTGACRRETRRFSAF